MLNKQNYGFIGCECNYNEAKTVIFGAPFDSTTSFRPGTRFGPKAIRADSFGMETFSPYQERDLTDIAVMDSGDLELPFGNTKKALSMIEERTAQILADGKKPVMLGGEHLVTLGAVSASLQKYPDLHVLHFDAHCDLRKDYLGERLSHATVIRRVWDILGDGRIIQLGIRSGDRDEFEFASKHTEMHRFNLKLIDEAIDKLSGKHVYFTLDLDVLDASVFPGTGTPEAGGIGFTELLNAIIKIKKLNIVGCDINELCPVYDSSGVSTAIACKLLRELLLAITE